MGRLYVVWEKKLQYLIQQQEELESIDSSPFYKEQLEKYKDTLNKIKKSIKEYKELLKALKEHNL